MTSKTSIEWTDRTWNPIRGCSRISPGCVNCYAERIAARFSNPGGPFHLFADRQKSGSAWTGKVELMEDQLRLPLGWRKASRVFVNSMSDLFHESLSDGEILRVFDVMARCPWHTFQVLSKRPKRMLDWMRKWTDTKEASYEPKLARGPDAVRKVHTCGRAMMFASMLDSMGTPPPGCAYPTYDWMQGMAFWSNRFSNVWLGTSVEDRSLRSRIDELMLTPAAKRFISYEPALGELDLTDYLGHHLGCDGEVYPCQICESHGRLDWVIIGGESGPGARLFDIAWAKSVIEQCKAAGVPVFMKQFGARPVSATGDLSDWPESSVSDVSDGDNIVLRDPKGGNPNEWPEWARVRQFPGEALRG